MNTACTENQNQKVTPSFSLATTSNFTRNIAFTLSNQTSSGDFLTKSINMENSNPSLKDTKNSQKQMIPHIDEIPLSGKKSATELRLSDHSVQSLDDIMESKEHEFSQRRQTESKKRSNVTMKLKLYKTREDQISNENYQLFRVFLDSDVGLDSAIIRDKLHESDFDEDLDT